MQDSNFSSFGISDWGTGVPKYAIHKLRGAENENPEMKIKRGKDRVKNDTNNRGEKRQTATASMDDPGTHHEAGGSQLV